MQTPDSLFQQAKAAFDQQNFAAAREHLTRLVANQPGHIEALHLLCRVCHQLRDLPASLQAAQQALAADPTQAESEHAAAWAHFNLRQYVEALEHYRKAHALDPTHAGYLFQIGVIHGELEQFDDAIAAYRRVLALQPQMHAARLNLASVLERAGRYHEAITTLQEAESLQPEAPPIPRALASTYLQCGKLAAAQSAYERAIALQPNDALTQASYVFTTNYLPDMDDAKRYALHREWAERFARVKPGRPGQRDADPDRRLRVGYVSRNLNKHPISYFLLPLLIHHDAAQFEIYAYALNRRHDKATGRIRERVHHWRDVEGLPHDRIAAQIEADGIDILVDLSSFEYPQQMRIFTLRPAPIQVSWLGYFHSSGMDLDYFISDIHSSTAESAAFFSEQLIRLPHTRFCYEPDDYAPEVAPLPSAAGGPLTFGCFNNAAKLNDEVIALWSRVLQAVPDSRLLLKARPFGDTACVADFRARFAMHGIAADRLVFQPFSYRHRDLLAAYHAVDIALDPFPFTGGLTSFEALWMGVPVLTLPGSSLVSRQTYAMLQNLELGDWAAASAEDYVRIAAEKARDRNELARLRQTMRDRMRASPLLDGAGFARDMEAAYRQMWQAWCCQQAD
jgi:protein O-GlcNAc transferase